MFRSSVLVQVVARGAFNICTGEETVSYAEWWPMAQLNGLAGKEARVKGATE